MIPRIEDDLGRSFKKLRLSVTSACNYRCYYCHPDSNALDSLISNQTIGQPNSLINANSGNYQLNYQTSMPANARHSSHHLSAQSLADYALSIHKITSLTSVRITGGEPTLYPHLYQLIKLLKNGGIPKLSLTTNGSHLLDKLSTLKEIGLDSINISLDAIDPIIFKEISGGGDFTEVLAAIEACLNSGIKLKINSTIIRGINHKEVIPLLEFCKQRKIEIRFIELMEMGHLHNRLSDLLYSASDILKDISDQYKYVPVPREIGSTAEIYRINDQYEFGIIANSSHPFCSDCDRLRLDSKGNVYGCLSVNEGESLESADIPFILEKALSQKRRDRFIGSSLSMKSIGG